MTLFRSVAIAMLALVAQPIWAQDFRQFTAAGPPVKADQAAKAVYVGLKDTDATASTKQFESLRDSAKTINAKQFVFESPNDSAIVTSRISDSGITRIPTSIVRPGISESSTAKDDSVSQTSLLGPSCGIAGCTDPACGLPDPACGVPGPACGLPSGPVCGLPDVACGLPSDAACGLPSIVGEPTCGIGGGCDSCGGCKQIKCGSLCTRNCPECCGVGTHYSRFYGDVLYLRSRSTEVAYAVAADGPISPGAVPIQVGNIGIVDSDYELGFRAGWNVALDTVSSIDVRYTLFESFTEDETSNVAPFIVRSMVSHPSTPNASSDVLSSLASLEVDFDVIDVSYRHLWKCYDLFSANYVIGARYAKLEQQFDVDFVKNVEESVSTDIDFDGAGMRIGLETERYSCRNRLSVYANGYASFLAGRYRAHYFQGNNFDGEEVNTEWEAGRVVPIVDLEAGVGWSSIGGKLQLSAGYMVSAWFNSVSTQDFINAVQTNSYLDMGDSIWFDGLQARVSYSF